MTRTAIVAGASGFIGRRIAERLRGRFDYRVIGLSRSARQTPGMTWIGVDLTDADDCRARLGAVTGEVDIYYAGRYDHPEGVPESVELNTAMLVNLVTVLGRTARLRHVHAVHGSKYYGHPFGPVPVPLHEGCPRGPVNTFYFPQEDFLRERSRAEGWSYSTTRPHTFSAPDIDEPRSGGLVFAVYATLQKALGLPLDFPGTEKSFRSKVQFLDLDLLARCIEWIVGEPRCANEAFDVVNGDHPTWAEMWSDYAAYFDMPCGGAKGFRLAEYMADKAPVWDRIVREHALRPTKLHEIALWAYGDFILKPDWDIVSTMRNARVRGFTDTVDSKAMFRRFFDHYRAERVIP